MRSPRQVSPARSSRPRGARPARAARAGRRRPRRRAPARARRLRRALGGRAHARAEQRGASASRARRTARAASSAITSSVARRARARRSCLLAARDRRASVFARNAARDPLEPRGVVRDAVGRRADQRRRPRRSACRGRGPALRRERVPGEPHDRARLDLDARRAHAREPVADLVGRQLDARRRRRRSPTSACRAATCSRSTSISSPRLGTPRPSAGPNDEPRLRREPARHRERQVGAAEAAREQPHEIEVAEERGAPDLREPDPVRRVRRARADVAGEPHALARARSRDRACAASRARARPAMPPPRSETSTSSPRRHRPAPSRARRPLGRAERAQRDQPVLAHLRQIARDAAVVADELALDRARRPRGSCGG